MRDYIIRYFPPAPLGDERLGPLAQRVRLRPPPPESQSVDIMTRAARGGARMVSGAVYDFDGPGPPPPRAGAPAGTWGSVALSFERMIEAPNMLVNLVQRG
jgi:hypothetical protein